MTKTRSVVTQSLQYLSGLLRTVRKNIERKTEVVPETEYQSKHHFTTHSPWAHRPVMDQVALDADRLLGGSPDTALVIDESSLPKKGKKSVGVARQWCGRLGKVDNCQTGVYASLVRGVQATIIDCRLYLPKEWTTNSKRCQSAGVPGDIEFKSKSQLALDIIRHARSTGIRYAWIGVDGGYGKKPLFLKALDNEGEQFVADVHKDQSVYLEDPCPYVPEKQASKGRAPSLYRTDTPRITVAKWANDQPKDAWQRITTRDSTKGLLQVDILTRRVWVWLDKKQCVRLWHLVVRRETDSQKTIK